MIGPVTLYQVASSGITPVASRLAAMAAYAATLEGALCSNPDGHTHVHDVTSTNYQSDCIYDSTGIHQWTNLISAPTLWESSGLDPAAGATTVGSVSGTVTVTDATGTNALTASNGIVEGDTVTTAANGSTTLTMGDDTSVSLLSNSTLDVIAAGFTAGSPANVASLILQEGVAEFVTGLNRTGSFAIEVVTGSGAVTLNDGTTIGLFPGSMIDMAQELYFGANSPANSALIVVQEGIASVATAAGALGKLVIETVSGAGNIQLPAGQVSLLSNSTLDILAAGFAPGTPGGDVVMILQDGAAQFSTGLKQTGEYIVHTSRGVIKALVNAVPFAQ